ncbi:MAG: 50S ribosomal protein L21 [Anaerolineales bacterium]
MKYAVVETGGKQYIAREGEMIEVDRLPLDVGKPVEFKDVLLIVDGSSVQVGDPLIKGASVKGEVLDQIKGKKIIVFKYIPKERYRRKQGHRQRYTQIRIDEIIGSGAKKSSAANSEETPPAEKKTAKPSAKKSEAKPAPSKVKKSAEKPKSARKSGADSESKSKSAGSKPKASSKAKSSASKRSTSSSQKSPSKKTSKKKEE